MTTAPRRFIAAVATLAMLALACASCEKPLRVDETDRYISREDARAIVVVHSRTGNTATFAKKIAAAVNADLVWLETEPRAGGEVAVQPAEMDLSAYRLVFLGSPIWYGHQTNYIDAFANANDFSGTAVVLFNTYGGIQRPGFPESWIELVEKRGAGVLHYMGVARGGKTDADVLAEMDGLIEEHKAEWLRAMDAKVEDR